MSKMVPVWLQMPIGSEERLIAWISWRRAKQPKITYAELERDGSYDLYRLISKSVKKRIALFKKAYQTLEHQFK